MRKFSLKKISKTRFIPLLFPLTFFQGCIDVTEIYSEANSSKAISEENISETEIIKPMHEPIIPDQTQSLYAGTPNDPLYYYQWHLKQLETENIWAKYSGTGIKVSVIDSGIEMNHQDLVDNIDFNLSYRYSDNSYDSSPDFEQLRDSPYDSAHGTACAGIIGAEGWNKTGLIGIAPTVHLIGLNTFSTNADADFEDALGNIFVDISNNSWGGDKSTQLYDDPASVRGIENGIKNGRDGKGVIYTFASGNEGNNANYSTLHGNRYVFNIGAIIIDGEIPNYSNFGDNLLIVAPAGDENLSENRGIFTTDLTGLKYGFDNYFQTMRELRWFGGDYTGFMNGTSSAVPVASGVIALILQANSELTYRDVKYILIKTAKVSNIDNIKYKWEKNNAGIYFSPYYGFGSINLIDSIEMAENFVNLDKEIYTENEIFPNLAISDNGNQEVSTIEIDNNIKIEHVELEINIPNHQSIGDLEIILTSPNGTNSILMYGDTKMSGRFINWKLNSLRFFDENSKGTWILKIRDKVIGNVGTLQSWKLLIHGR